MYPSSDHSIDHSMSKYVEVESAKDGHYVWIYEWPQDIERVTAHRGEDIRQAGFPLVCY